MGVGLVISAVSLLLLLYWFRYSCALILAAKGGRDYASQVTAENNLAFQDISRRLAEPSTPACDLERFNALLQRDYDIVTAIIDTTARLQAARESGEQRMLQVFYHFLRARYAISRGVSVPYSSGALAEICDVLGYFANVAGEAVYCNR